MQNVPRLVVAAVRGGLGKTTLSLGIIGAWRARGRKIAPFKKGPDFIDAGWLGAAAGSACYNLDLFLMEEESIRRSFVQHTAGCDAAVIEGNRGLYDGVDEAGTYSTARLAAVLQAPVVLIVDCTKSSSTVAAVALGCRQYDPSVDLAGVILNNVSSTRHETVIRKAMARTGIAVLGAVPRMRKGEFPERHMGLTPFHEHPDVAGAVASAIDLADRFLDLGALWRAASERAGQVIAGHAPAAVTTGADRPVIGVVRDRAFQFYYPDNLEALEAQGAVIREINALEDRELPAVDALYIGGGFPETQAAGLAENRSFSRSLREAADSGLPVYAECGGLIYLGRSLRVGDAVYPMAGLLPADFVLEARPQAHGYTIVEVDGENPFFDKGSILRGHEFHYSRIMNTGDLPGLAFFLQRGHGIEGQRDGVVHRSVLGTYTHLHAAGAPAWAAGLVRRAREYRDGRKRGAA
jgi:cobyrinic acid a,c-diamide synthase